MLLCDETLETGVFRCNQSKEYWEAMQRNLGTAFLLTANNVSSNCNFNLPYENE